MEAASSVKVREHNQNLVRRELLRMKRATKSQLAAATGLSQMTVGAGMTFLLENGEAEEGKHIPSNGGRPSVEYVYRKDFGKAAVLYSYQKEQKNFVRLVVCNLFGECLYQDNRFFDSIEENSFDRMLAKAFEAVEGIRTIGLGLPGLAADGEILANDHPALVGKRLFQRYQRLYQVPVLFVNDVNAAVWGYSMRRRQELGLEGTIAAIYFPVQYPPGMGLTIDGKLYTGHRGFVGESHYVPLGIHWKSLPYHDEGKVVDAIVKLLSAMCGIVAPDRFILYGDFFRAGMAEKICQKAEALFSGTYGFHIEAAANLEEDYRAGMISLSLKVLKQTLFGETWEDLELC